MSKRSWPYSPLSHERPHYCAWIVWGWEIKPRRRTLLKPQILMTDFDWIEVANSSDFLETSDEVTMKEYEEACEFLAKFKGF